MLSPIWHWALAQRFSMGRAFVPLWLLALIVVMLPIPALADTLGWGALMGFALGAGMAEMSLGSSSAEYGFDVAYVLSRPLGRKKALNARLLAHLIFFLCFFPAMILADSLKRTGDVPRFGPHSPLSTGMGLLVIYALSTLFFLHLGTRGLFRAGQVHSAKTTLWVVPAVLPPAIFMGLFSAHRTGHSPTAGTSDFFLSLSVAALLLMGVVLVSRRWNRWDVMN